jgi:adenylate kinase family enzyme
MKRVAVFGNAGGGKSTLARNLAAITGLPLHVLDIVQFPGGGDKAKISKDNYLKLHADLIGRDEWIIDGFENMTLAWERFARADTLVYVDLPLATHYWFVTKRLVKGLFTNPPGWPANTPVWASSMDSYKVLWRCHRGLTPKYRQYVAEMAATKRVHHLKSLAEMRGLLDAVKREYAA